MALHVTTMSVFFKCTGLAYNAKLPRQYFSIIYQQPTPSLISRGYSSSPHNKPTRFADDQFTPHDWRKQLTTATTHFTSHTHVPFSSVKYADRHKFR
ncbi:hypothetical protein BaRGS_00030116 [Batillaria attramentaria]|uniref:Uncharacterized protein n=1 Tax=Batillaria attramentaria TaxID=370345 RepID=A0ABD0JUT9_9CAEN